jgi:ribonuclease-3
MNDNDLKKVENKIKYIFKNKELLRNAFTHKTYAFEAKNPLEYNERLEFLGDSILNFIIAEQLYKSNKYFSEGELTRRRAALVNNSVLAEKAKKLELGRYLDLGMGEKKQKGDRNPTNLANALEALIGAVYLDSDKENVWRFILTNLYDESLQF